MYHSLHMEKYEKSHTKTINLKYQILRGMSISLKNIEKKLIIP